MRPALLLCVLGGAAGFLAPSPHRIARGGARWATFPALSDDEISRALDLWNIPIDDEKLDDLIAACDTDGDGHVVYNEFVDVLARS